MSEREKTYVEDVNRSIYDIRNEEKDVYRVKEGLTPEIVDQISKEKHDPDWMREFRQEALKLAERIGVAAAARELNLYESQLYNWRSKQQNQQTSSERELEMSTEIARLKRQLAERDEELAILQKAATYFAKRLK